MVYRSKQETQSGKGKRPKPPETNLKIKPNHEITKSNYEITKSNHETENSNHEFTNSNHETNIFTMTKLFGKPNSIGSFYRIKMALVPPVMGIKKKRKTITVLRFIAYE